MYIFFDVPLPAPPVISPRVGRAGPLRSSGRVDPEIWGGGGEFVQLVIDNYR